MIEELHVRDLGLIEDVWLEFGPGMNVLSGETGAGKTVLIGALKLLIGERADSMSVRSGADHTLVEGRLVAGGTELVVKRRVGADGRSKCTLDDEMTTVGRLAERLGPLVDLHGQHDHQSLLRPASHVGYLDRWAGAPVSRRREEYGNARAAWGEAVERYRGLVAARADASARADHLRFVVEEIEQVAPRPGEDAELEARLPALRHSDRLVRAAATAADALGSEGGARDTMAGAVASLDGERGLDPALDELSERLRSGLFLLEDAVGELRDYRDRVEHDPDALETVEARLVDLRALTRKHGPTLDDVIRAGEEARSAVLALETGAEELRIAHSAQRESEEELRSAAAELEAARSGAVPGFIESLTTAARDLAMEGARFDVGIGNLPFEEWTELGSQRIEFLYAPAADLPARPLARIASGGEVSRVMLALKSVLGEADEVPVLVFDEIDAGVGGSTAHSVGRRLAQLARTHQVLVVTHLAQVAAYADRHLVVQRTDADGRSATTVRLVEGQDRVAETARMLSGSETDASRAHAAELLEGASTAP